MITSATGNGSALRAIGVLLGAVATSIAVAVTAVLAVMFAATLVVIGFMGAALLGLTAFALRARRPGAARAAAATGDPTLIEARNTGGHSWVAYGWNERR